MRKLTTSQGIWRVLGCGVVMALHGNEKKERVWVMVYCGDGKNLRGGDGSMGGGCG